MTQHHAPFDLRGLLFTVGLGLGLALCACALPTSAVKTHGEPGDAVTRALRDQVQTVVVIYAENRAFDNLYGNFPGASGLSDVLDARGHPLPTYMPQRDRDGSIMPRLPPTWGGVTASGYEPVVTQAESTGLPDAISYDQPETCGFTSTGLESA